MNPTRLAVALAAAVISAGLAVGGATPAGATDNIKTFGEQERLNGPNRLPYIGYTVYDLAPSSDPVPHNGTLFKARLAVEGFGGNANPMIERFGARSQSGTFYPSIWGASNTGVLYFDVVADEPNSVVWNDGIRDILAWIPGDVPLQPASVMEPPPEPLPEAPPPMAPEASPEVPSMPAESDAEIVATPNDIAPPPFELTEAEVAEPGFGR